MADEKLNTGPAENISPEAAEPITTPEQAAASEPQQEQTGPAIPESGDVVVSFDKINELKSLVYKGALIHRCRCCAPCRGRCVLRPRWEATLPKPLVRSAQPNTRFAFVRLHRACYPLTERRCSP